MKHINKYCLFLCIALSFCATNVYSQNDREYQKMMADIKAIERDMKNMMSLFERLSKRERNNFNTLTIYVMEISFNMSAVPAAVLNYIPPSALSEIRNKIQNSRSNLYYSETESSIFNSDMHALSSYRKYGIEVRSKGRQANPRANSNNKNTANQTDDNFTQNNDFFASNLFEDVSNFFEDISKIAESTLSPREQNRYSPENQNDTQIPELNAYDISKYIVKPKNEEKDIVDFCKQPLMPNFCECVLDKFSTIEGKNKSNILYDNDIYENFQKFKKELSDEIDNQIKDVEEKALIPEYELLKIVALNKYKKDLVLYQDKENYFAYKKEDLLKLGIDEKTINSARDEVYVELVGIDPDFMFKFNEGRKGKEIVNTAKGISIVANTVKTGKLNNKLERGKKGEIVATSILQGNLNMKYEKKMENAKKALDELKKEVFDKTQQLLILKDYLKDCYDENAKPTPKQNTNILLFE